MLLHVKDIQMNRDVTIDTQLLSFQQILCQEAAASTVGARGSSPCLKGMCVHMGEQDS